jgi:bifunctional DNase/RNase
MFNKQDYFQAVVESVSTTNTKIPVVCLRLDNEERHILPIYMGDAESAALVHHMYAKPTSRPITHDLTRDLLQLAGFKVKLVVISKLVGNTYHSRVHIESSDGQQSYDVDSRPSDAVNLAVRFGAPIYVRKTLAAKMGVANCNVLKLSPAVETEIRVSHENHQAIVDSCRAECALHRDTLVAERMMMDLAVAQERFEDAIHIRDKIDREVQNDMGMRLMANIEAALDDQRYEEAARLRDELRALRLSSPDTHWSAPEHL